MNIYIFAPAQKIRAGFFMLNVENTKLLSLVSNGLFELVMNDNFYNGMKPEDRKKVYEAKILISAVYNTQLDEQLNEINKRHSYIKKPIEPAKVGK